MCAKVAQCAQKSPSVRKNRPMCAKIAQCAQKSPNVRKNRPMCAKIAQCAQKSPNMRKNRIMGAKIALTGALLTRIIYPLNLLIKIWDLKTKVSQNRGLI
jgi:hypothetical protein